ncbi:von Willebrand factor A domain-containing protein 8 [Blyttiomyces sp. JEL0837]|nr:von Willebrand factor A domain-containing protein 8 [Blyttiomyces sp. JEL0837]
MDSIEGVTGEKAIYKRRGENENDPSFQQKPKKMFVTFDLSASMTRFNGYDSRLERSLQCALLIMEAFKNFEHKFQYRIAGHSGDTPDIQFVAEGKYPKNEKEMFEVLSRMNAHSQYCLSGDNTLNAAVTNIKNIVAEEADDYFVLILSDANLNQYGLQPSTIAKALKANDKVNAFMIFVGSLQDQAEQLSKAMPGNAYVCLDTKDLPKILKTIFVNILLFDELALKTLSKFQFSVVLRDQYSDSASVRPDISMGGKECWWFCGVVLELKNSDAKAAACFSMFPKDVTAPAFSLRIENDDVNFDEEAKTDLAVKASSLHSELYSSNSSAGTLR